MQTGVRQNNGDDVKEGRRGSAEGGRKERSIRPRLRPLAVRIPNRPHADRKEFAHSWPTSKQSVQRDRCGVVSFGKSEEQNKWEARGL